MKEKIYALVLMRKSSSFPGGPGGKGLKPSVQKKQKGRCVWGTSQRFVVAGGWDMWAQMPFSQADPQPACLFWTMPQFVLTSVSADGGPIVG